MATEEKNDYLLPAIGAGLGGIGPAAALAQYRFSDYDKIRKILENVPIYKPEQLQKIIKPGDLGVTGPVDPKGGSGLGNASKLVSGSPTGHGIGVGKYKKIHEVAALGGELVNVPEKYKYEGTSTVLDRLGNAIEALKKGWNVKNKTFPERLDLVQQHLLKTEIIRKKLLDKAVKTKAAPIKKLDSLKGSLYPRLNPEDDDFAVMFRNEKLSPKQKEILSKKLEKLTVLPYSLNTGVTTGLKRTFFPKLKGIPEVACTDTMCGDNVGAANKMTGKGYRGRALPSDIFLNPDFVPLGVATSRKGMSQAKLREAMLAGLDRAASQRTKLGLGATGLGMAAGAGVGMLGNAIENKITNLLHPQKNKAIASSNTKTAKDFLNDPQVFVSLFTKLAEKRPGLWANIRAKRKRGETQAKPGDEDYPDKKQWNKLTKASEASPALSPKVAGVLRSLSTAPSHIQEAYINNPALHKLWSSAGGKARARNSLKAKTPISPKQLEFDLSVPVPNHNPPLSTEEAAEGFRLLKEMLNKSGSDKLDGLVTSHDLKNLKTYTLAKNELREPRELSPQEQKTVNFRKRFGWSLFNPLYDFKPRDVAQQIQNPAYRAIGDTLGSGMLNSLLPLAVGGAMRLNPSHTNKLTSKIFLGLGAANALTPALSIKQRIDKQLLYNKITEEYMRNHQEGSITTMDSILKDMLAKKRTPQSLKTNKRKVKTSSELYRLSPPPTSIQERAGSVMSDIFELGPAAIMSAMSAPFNIWGSLTARSRAKSELNDLRERFERKMRDKAEAEAFVEKVRMPLYKKHQGVEDKIQQFDQLFKTSEEKSPLLPHQARAIEKLKQPDQPGLILMHGLGSGKTRSSIEAYKQLGMPAEVVVPAALRGNYEKEIKKWLGKHPGDVNIQSQQLIARNGASNEDFDGKLMILDEAHRMRNEDTKLYKALKNVSPAKRLLLTGTPIYNHPADIAKLINVAAGKTVLPETRPEFEKDYIGQRVVFPSFIHRLLGVKPGQELHVKNKEYLQHVFNKMIDYHGGNAEGFPEMTQENIRVPMEREQERIYKALMKQLPWHLRMKVRAGLPPEKKELDKLIPFLSGARMISNSSSGFTTAERSRSPKIEQAAEFFKTKLKEDPSYKALIYSNYLNSGVNPYKQQLDQAGIPYGEFTGDVNDKTRNELVKKYNENKLKALIISSAGGEGLDLKGTRLVQVLEPHFNNEKIKQVVGRAARYMSHSGLPKEKQNVLVQNYLSSLTPGMFSKILKKQQTSADEYLQNLSEQKEALNNAFINLIKKSGFEKTAKSYELLQLIEAKKKSDSRDFTAKNHIIQTLTHKHPQNFKVDSRLNKSYVGLTHIPTGFKIHAPKKILPASLF
jgi:superfamily II DNA or RNA helicase